jgi:hypothetical protein
MPSIMSDGAYSRPMARRSGGLDSAQVEQLREKLSNGGRPRVTVSGPQFPADTVGTIVRIGDPAVDGDDYVTVRTRVGGVADELAFSPSELSGTGKGAARTGKTGAGTPTQPPIKRGPGRPRKQIADAPRPTRPEPTPMPSPTQTPAPAPAPAPTVRSPTPTSVKSRRGGPTPPVKISITSSGATWTVSVDRGARTLVKNAAVAPGAVTAIAALIGNEGVEQAVAAVNDTARTEAEARAEQLRTELAEVQALLDSHLTP